MNLELCSFAEDAALARDRHYMPGEAWRLVWNALTAYYGMEVVQPGAASSAAFALGWFTERNMVMQPGTEAVPGDVVFWSELNGEHYMWCGIVVLGGKAVTVGATLGGHDWQDARMVREFGNDWRGVRVVRLPHR
jgi:hypothetical protein